MHDATVLEATGVEPERAAAVFAALGEPARLRILGVLADGNRCVCDIRSAIPMAGNLLSYHLRVLREASLIEGTRRGRWIDYRVTPDAVATVVAALDDAGFEVTPR